VVAVLFNYPWELAQSPLYTGTGNFRPAWWHCFVASLGDGVLVLLIFATGWVIRGQSEWFVRPGWLDYGLMVTAGLLLSVSVEWGAVHIAGRWAYNGWMSLVPGLAIGVVPVVQMLVLPPLILRVAAVWITAR
jgi:hypothetical protein